MRPPLTEHPACALFPSVTGSDLTDMAADIARQGLILPITVHEGSVLDGRARLAACALAGVQPRFETWSGTGDPTDWIVSRNLKRRQLDASQRAMVAARLTTRGPGRPAKAETFPVCTQAVAAENCQVTSRTIRHARRVLEFGGESLVAAVEAGTLPVSTASVLTHLPQGEQKDVLELDDREVLRRARDIQDRRRAERRRRRDEREHERGDIARRSAPTVEGVRLECVDVREFVQTVPRECAALMHADWPWPYKNHQNGNAAEHYDELSIDDIVRLTDAAYDLALPDTYLVMWCTFPQVFPFARAMVTAERENRFRWRDLTGGAWGKRLEDTDRKGAGRHARGDAELWFLFGKGEPAPLGRYHTNWHASRRGEHSEKDVDYLVDLVREYAPNGGLVVDLCAGLASMMRACGRTGHRYRGCESNHIRHRRGLDRFAIDRAARPGWSEGGEGTACTGRRLKGAPPVSQAPSLAPPSGPLSVEVLDA